VAGSPRPYWTITFETFGQVESRTIRYWAAVRGVLRPLYLLMNMTMAQSHLTTNEVELIKSICEGVREAFYELIRPYERMVYAAAMSVVNNPAGAEDVAQDAVLKEFSNLLYLPR
jgi:Sigma-70 region 2